MSFDVPISIIEVIQQVIVLRAITGVLTSYERRMVDVWTNAGMCASNRLYKVYVLTAFCLKVHLRVKVSSVFFAERLAEMT